MVVEKEMPLNLLKRGEDFQKMPKAGRKIKVPIEINGDGFILDGHHRLNQAIANGQKTIKAKVMPWRGEFEQMIESMF